MALELNVFMDDVWLQVGKKSFTRKYTDSLQPSSGKEYGHLGQAREYGLLLHWPKSDTFLTLGATHGDRNRFERGPKAFIAVAREVGAQTPDPAFLEGKHVAVARVRRGDPIVLGLLVDTDDPNFSRLATVVDTDPLLACQSAAVNLDPRADPNENKWLPLVHASEGRYGVGLISGLEAGSYGPGWSCASEPAEAGGAMTCKEALRELKHLKKHVKVRAGVMAFAAGESEEGHINLILSPVAPVLSYEGYVALDVGNTSSTLVCLPPGSSRARTSAIQVLDANEEKIGALKANPDPTISHVRIDQIDNFSDSPASVKWTVGRVASTAIDGLVAGPKRLAAARDWEEKRIFNMRQRTALPQRVPAELLVTRILQRFREATSRHPEELALTYPTTYEPRELRQLREVVWRGFRRASWNGQSQAREEEIVTRRVPVLLDEASAAAYFYLYQRILEAPGGLPRFRYLYPDGLNLLLYDCGGGTTDVALVSARSEPGSNKLVIGVKARSGLRGFGGDNITVAVFRLLKAKLALEIDRLEGKKKLGTLSFPDKPIGGKELEDFLQKGFPSFDALVPTTFGSGIDDESRQRRSHALDLWQKAEALKCKLQEGGSAALGVLVTGAGKGQPGLWDQLLSRFSGNLVKEKEAREKLQQIKVQRWEVDALIRPEVEISIDNCNKLIQEKLIDAGEEVHWVIASGNGARYPLIKELLQERLAVQMLEDGRFYIDPENLKHAVAKGAVLYLATLRAERQLDVEFDTVLSDCLPFDVVYRDPVTNTYSVLFHEHDRYEEIASREPVRLNLVGAGEGGAARQVSTHRISLARRWPGDGDAYSDYLRFEFEQDVQLPVEVSFDRDNKQFKVVDSNGQVGKPIEASDNRVYESPVQRGDL